MSLFLPYNVNQQTLATVFSKKKKNISKGLWGKKSLTASLKKHVQFRLIMQLRMFCLHSFLQRAKYLLSKSAAAQVRNVDFYPLHNRNYRNPNLKNAYKIQ